MENNIILLAVTYLVGNYPVITTIIAALTAIVIPASLIANFTPNTTDDKIVATISKVVNWCALNIKTAPKK